MKRIELLGKESYNTLIKINLRKDIEELENLNNQSTKFRIQNAMIDLWNSKVNSCNNEWNRSNLLNFIIFSTNYNFMTANRLIFYYLREKQINW